MFRYKGARKKAIHLTLNANVVEMAKQLGINVSTTVDVLLTREVERLYWERWNEENADAIAAYNERIRSEGLPLAKYRKF